MPHDHDENHAHQLLPAEPALRVKALETILVEKGLLDQQAVDAIIEEYEQKIGPQIGAKIVARAWNDPAFKSMLLADSEAVLREESTEQPEDVVIEELQRGYHLNGKVLRHALVKVSMGPGPSTDADVAAPAEAEES